MHMLFPDGTRTQPRVTSPFGNRWHPVSKKWKMHRGSDVVGFSTVRAIAAGTVYKVGTPFGWSAGGTQVWIKHDDGTMSRSLHLVKGSTLVVPKQRVAEGQAIGRMGMTGTATGVHLHLELVVNGKQINPLPYIAARLTPMPAVSGGVSKQTPAGEKEEDDMPIIIAQRSNSALAKGVWDRSTGRIREITRHENTLLRAAQEENRDQILYATVPDATYSALLKGRK